MVQIQFINKLLKSKSVDIVYDNDIGAEYFLDYSEEFSFIMNHYRKYGNVPDVETFLDKFNEFDIVDVSESDEYLVDKLKEEFQYTRVVPIIKEAGEKLKTDSFEACDYLWSAISALDDLSGTCGTDIVAEARSRYEEWKHKKDSGEPWMLPTGFKEIDDAIGGLAQGEEFVIYFARTNQCKSWVLCQTLTHCWKVGYNVGVVSPEMGSNLFGSRFDTLNGHFSNFALYTGREVEGYDDYISELTSGRHKNKFIVATPQDFNKKVTVSKLRKFVQKNNLDILGIDGIKYLTDERYRRGDSITTSLTNISEDLMSLSCELKIPIIAVIQANREGANDTGDAPALESIRDSDGPAQNATKVFSIKFQDSKLKIKLAKCRTGKVGAEFCYDCDIDTGTFKYTTNTDMSSSRASTQRQPVENKQPLRKMTNSSVPF